MTKKIVLFINACVRKESRTSKLCERYIKNFIATHEESGVDWDFTEVDLKKIDLKPLNAQTLEKRTELARKENFKDQMFYYAKQLLEADHIVIGAPYWDFSYPAGLKVYIENTCIDNLMFNYDEQGIPHGKCKARDATYIMTAGGYVSERNLGYEYISTVFTQLFGIENMHLLKAEGLDMEGADEDMIMKQAGDSADHLINHMYGAWVERLHS